MHLNFNKTESNFWDYVECMYSMFADAEDDVNLLGKHTVECINGFYH